MDQALIKGKRISYTDTGDGDVLVLLHGYLETKEVWSEFAKAMAENHRVITIDIPGHGMSETIAEVHDMNLIASVIDNLLLRLEVSKFCLVGHSMGGYVALAYAGLYTNNLSGLVLFHSSVFADNDEKRANRQREIDLIKAGKKELIFKSNLPRMFADDNVAANGAILNDISSKALQHDEDGVCALLRGMMQREDKQDLIKAFSKPTLFIFGEKDNYIPVPAGKSMSMLNSEIKVKWLKNSGHMGFIEEPEESQKVLSQFILDCNS